SILDNIPVRVFWKDRNLRYLGCNAAFAHDAGVDQPDAVIGKSDSDFSWRRQALASSASVPRLLSPSTHSITVFNENRPSCHIPVDYQYLEV
ncbi:hypothetical protein ACFL6U_11525, partial [Planctomycetota bacterium]